VTKTSASPRSAVTSWYKLRARNLQQGQIVSFKWIDSTAFTGWRDLDRECPAATVDSVGIVVRAQKDGLVITTSIAKSLEDSMDPVCVPWSAISKLKVLNVTTI